MHVMIETKEDQKLLGRTLVKGTLEFSGTTPSNTQVKEVLAQELKTTPDLVVPRQVNGVFGATKAKLWAYVYDSKESMDAFMPKKKQKAAGEQKKAEGAA